MSSCCDLDERSLNGFGPNLFAIAEIYAHYVHTSVATFELNPPDRDEWLRRFDAIIGAGLPFLVADRDGVVTGYAYCGPWKTRPAYRATVEDSIYISPSATSQGCGAELLRDLLDAAGAIGIREVIAVIADTGNPASVALRRRFGFIDAGRLTNVGYTGSIRRHGPRATHLGVVQSDRQATVRAVTSGSSSNRARRSVVRMVRPVARAVAAMMSS